MTVFLYCAIPTLLVFGGAAAFVLLPHGRVVSYRREAETESVGELMRLPGSRKQKEGGLRGDGQLGRMKPPPALQINSTKT